MNKLILVWAALLGMLSIILGAFGAHGLKNLVTPEMVAVFETGVKYQMYHALLLLFVGSSSTLSKAAKKTVFWLVLVGLLLFSGSIYGLATNALSAFNFKSIGFVTPIGGLLLILAWGVLLVNFVKRKND